MTYLSEQELAESVNRLVRVNIMNGTARSIVSIVNGSPTATIVYNIDLANNRCELLDDSELDLSLMIALFEQYKNGRVRSVYTYHHDYVRSVLTSMSRSDVAGKFEHIDRRLSSEYYLYSCAIIQLLNSMTIAQVISIVTPGQILMLKKCVELAEQELLYYSEYLNS